MLRIGIGIFGRRGRSWTPTPEYETVLNAMSSPPSIADQKIQNTWLKAMVDKGYYAKAELLDMFCVDIAANGLFNWKNPSAFNPSLVGSFVAATIQDEQFKAYEGFRGAFNGSCAVRLNFNPTANATLTSQNNTCIIIGVGSDFREDKDDVGVRDGSTRLQLRTRTASDTALYADNNALTLNSANTNSIKYYAVSRNGAATYDSYLNKTKTVRTVDSSGFPNKEMYACGFNDDGTITYNSKRIRFVFRFSYLTEAEVLDVIDITEAYLTNYHTNLINYDNYIAKPYKDTKAVVALTTYDGSGEVCHPSVAEIPAGWNGYKYWMAATPYPASNGAYENPSIWASNDGVTWVVPDGLTNPVIAKPAGYNADPDLLYNSDDNKLYMIWKDSTGSPHTKICSSSDGVTWTGNSIILTPSGVDTENTSPSLIKIGSKFYIYYLGLNATPLNSVIKRVSCDTIDGTYTNVETVNVPPANVGVAKIWWHLGIRYLNGAYYLIASSSYDAGVGTEVYVMKSTDGLNFVKSPYPSIYYSFFSTEINRFHRPCLATIEGQTTVYYSIYTSANKWAIIKMNIDLL